MPPPSEPNPSEFQVPPDPDVLKEIREKHARVDSLAKEINQWLEEGEVEDLALARMLIERGYSEAFAHWMVREAEVRRAARMV